MIAITIYATTPPMIICTIRTARHPSITITISITIGISRLPSPITRHPTTATTS
jgi:hypothetical protein